MMFEYYRNNFLGNSHSKVPFFVLIRCVVFKNEKKTSLKIPKGLSEKDIHVKHNGQKNEKEADNDLQNTIQKTKD